MCDFNRRPQMMEPPASPETQHEEGCDKIELIKTDQAYRSDTDVTTLEGHKKNDFFENKVDADVYQQDRETGPECDDVDIQDTQSVYITRRENTSDDDQSVAESDLPQTFVKTVESVRSTVPTNIHYERGFFKGRVLRAVGLQTSQGLDPSAFVRISFSKSGSAIPASAMIRCKETLATTGVIETSANPIWSDVCLKEDDPLSHFNGDTDFRVELLPRIVLPATKSDWYQLLGDVHFTVYSILKADGGSRNRGNEHIGEATISVRSLLQDLLTTCPFTTRVIELRSRGGKRLGHRNVPSRSHSNNERVEAPTLTVSFQFIPIHEQETYQDIVGGSSKVLSVSKSATISCKLQKTRSAKQTPPAKTSSSCINRRRFEKQIAKENRSLAKRLELEKACRTRRLAHLQAQEKKTLPQFGARKHGHKAHAEINRIKFVQKVAEENKEIGRRLQNIHNTEGSSCKSDKYLAWAAAETGDSSNYIDRDKTHAQDKRWQRQVELDYVMEKSQTNYQQQHQIVEEITTLQEAVANLKSQEDKLKKTLSRLEMTNNKKRYVRDRLQAATDSTSSTAKTLPRQVEMLRSKNSVLIRNDKGDQEAGRKTQKEREYELLSKHRECLQADKLKLSQDLKALNQQETELDNEIYNLELKWKYAKATQLFQRRMDKMNAVQVQQAIKDMKRRLKSLEITSEEEAQWAWYQTHQEFMQLQLALQVLRDQNGRNSRCMVKTSSPAVLESLTKKVEKHKSKLQQLEDDVERVRVDYEAMIVSEGYECLRKRVQELQKLLFLCKSHPTQVIKANRMAQYKGEEADMEFQRRLFHEQTETDIVLK
ncbi:uncharacterized protein PHALS_02942 [Plasmopara halstedii]|uniref:C2 domain-containing protein n=1 Tax=Plasmopara halstedii TaxID=4781 RepID=A0A0P1AYH9_PLAHL|nr:uncharacterized protein PHALS_02942 [Plasmopara halstedii]CEG46543.1 hypothetical protein PHALS_02942 [Plasmopara halstedii]|eukprot:XP_024582912.1 hypothetical protein PHALS_02942 [Plasmopara halstedii]